MEWKGKGEGRERDGAWDGVGKGRKGRKNEERGGDREGTPPGFLLTAPIMKSWAKTLVLMLKTHR